MLSYLCIIEFGIFDNSISISRFLAGIGVFLSCVSLILCQSLVKFNFKPLMSVLLIPIFLTISLCAVTANSGNQVALYQDFIKDSCTASKMAIDSRGYSVGTVVFPSTTSLLNSVTSKSIKSNFDGAVLDMSQAANCFSGSLGAYYYESLKVDDDVLEFKFEYNSQSYYQYDDSNLWIVKDTSK
jgi:hypothetical protein